MGEKDHLELLFYLLVMINIISISFIQQTHPEIMRGGKQQP